MAESKFVLCRHAGVEKPALLPRTALAVLPEWVPVQDAAEGAGPPTVPAPLPEPARNASQDAWEAYAIQAGADPAAAADSTRTELIDTYATEEN